MPWLLTRSMQPMEQLHPVAYSLQDKLTPLSTAAITLPHDAPEVPLRAFVELFTADGSVGIFRVVNRRSAELSTIDLTLQHGLCTLSDHMHPGESEETGSCRTLLTKLLSNQSRWVLGTVDVPDEENLTWSCNNTNDLQGLTDIMKELTSYYLDFDQRALPWVLHVRKKPEEIRCEARIDRNLVDVQVEYDSSEMCNVAYADGLDAPIVADNVDDWERIERHVSADEDLDADILTKTVKRYLEQHKDPRVTITLTAVELSRLTGEPFDSFRKGQLCRCILDDMTVVQRIETVERPDPIGAPEEVVLTLASTQNDLSVTVAGLVVDTRVVNQLYHQLDRKLKIEAEEIKLRAFKSEVDGLSTRVGDAEILLNDVLGEIELRVSYKEFGDAMNTVSITLDAQNDAIDMKADRTYVNDLIADYATIESLRAVEAAVNDLEALIGDFTVIDANYVTASEIRASFLTASSFTHAGSFVSQRSISMGSVSTAGAVLSTGDLNLAHSHLISENGGVVTLGEVSSTGGSFNIADTQFYKDGVSAAIESVTVYSPFVNSEEHPGGTSHMMRVYMQAKASNGAESAVVSELISAQPVYDVGHNAGWNDCLDNCSPAEVYTISENAPGTLYVQSGGQYINVGSSWVQVTRKYGVYTIPSAKT